MDNGYVYVLSNATMPGLVKIGKTTRSSDERARELSRSTSIPTRFVVEYEFFSPATSELERAVHAKLESARHSSSREFFATEPLQAIAVIRSLAESIRLKFEGFSCGDNESFERYEAIDILGRLRKLYMGMIRPEVVAARIYQTRLHCYLETVEEEVFPAYEPVPVLNQRISRNDLGFVVAKNLQFRCSTPEIMFQRMQGCFSRSSTRTPSSSAVVSCLRTKRPE